MADMSKFSPDNGLTVLNIKDAVARSSVAAQNVLLKDTVGWVVKNYLKLSNLITSAVSYMVTDGSLSVFGTAGSNDSNYSVDFDLPDGDYIFYTGYIPSDSATTLNIFKVSQGSPTSEIAIINNSSENNYIPFTVDHDGYDSLQFRIWNNKGTTYNYTCYPMVCKAEVFNGTFEPYHESADEYLASKGLLEGTVGWIGKNLLKYPYTDTTKTDHQVTFTDNGDGSITINGTASGGNAYFTFFGASGSTEKIIPPGKYKITSNGLGDNIQIMPVYKIVGYSDLDNVDAVDGLSYMCVRVPNGKTVDNVTIHPMIRDASITDDTYEPYHKTVEEMFNNDLGTASAQVLKDTVGWIGINNLDKSNRQTYNATATDTSTGINISCTNKANANAYLNLNDLELNKQYKISTDVDYTSGLGAIVVLGSTDGATYSNIIDSIESIATDGKRVLSFNTGSYPYIRISLFVTRTTAQDGNISFNELMLYDAIYIEPVYEPYHESVAKYCASKQDVKDIVGWGNKNIGVWYNVSLSGDATVGYKLNSGGSSLIAKVANNTDYTVSKKSGQGNRFRINGFTNEPSSVATLNAAQLYSNNSANEYTVNSGSYNYLVFTFESSSTISQDTAEAMIELGSVKTAYEPYHASVEDTLRDAEVVEGKNLLPNKATTTTLNGVTFTVNDNKSITISTVNTGATATTQLTLDSSFEITDDREYIYSGATSGSASTYYLQVYYRDNNNVYKGAKNLYTEPLNIKLSNFSGATKMNTFILVVQSGAVITTPVTVYPMLRLESETDPTYEPYYVPLKDVVPTKANKSDLGTSAYKNSTSVVTDSSDLVESGAVKDIVGWGNKNKLQVRKELTSTSLFTVNRNNYDEVTSIVGNGSVTADQTLWLIGNGWNYSNCEDVSKYFKAGQTYTLSDGTNNDANQFIQLNIRDSEGVIISARSDNLNDYHRIFTMPSDLTGLKIHCWLRVNNGQSMTNKVFYPQLEEGASITSFEPYHASVSDSLDDKCDNSVIGTVEGANASKAWSVGEHFISGGQFKEVTQPISNGGAINDSNTVNKPIADIVTIKKISVTPSTGVTFNTANAVKIFDKLIMINIVIDSISLSTGSATQIGYVETSAKPSKEIYAAGVSNNSTPIRIAINTNGSIFVAPQTAITSGKVGFSMIYEI